MANLTPKEIQKLFYFSIEEVLPYINPELFGVRYFFDNKEIGYASIFLHSRRMSWDKFFPFEFERTRKLRKKGIGTLAHVSPLLKLIEQGKLNMNHLIARSSIVSYEREKQYRAMDLFGRKRLIPLRKYLEKSINYALSKGFKIRNPLK